MYTWRNGISIGAVDAFGSFFSNDPVYETADARVKYAKNILKGGQLFYRDPDSDVKEVSV